MTPHGACGLCHLLLFFYDDYDDDAVAVAVFWAHAKRPPAAVLYVRCCSGGCVLGTRQEDYRE